MIRLDSITDATLVELSTTLVDNWRPGEPRVLQSMGSQSQTRLSN